MPTICWQDRQRFVTQTLASWRLEGFDPDAEYYALLGCYISGDLSLDDIAKITNVNFGLPEEQQASRQ